MPKRGPTTPPVKRRSHLETLHNVVTGSHSSSSEGLGGLGSDHGSPRPASPLRTARRSRFSSVPLVDIRTGENEKEEMHQVWPASVELPRRHVYSTFYADSDSESSHSGGGLCSMSDALESSCKSGGSGSPSTQPSVRIKHVTRNSESPSRFPKLDECAHFHYDNVELGPIDVSLCEEQPSRWAAPPTGESANCSPSASSFQSSQGSSGEQQSTAWFWVRVSTQGRTWELRRSWENFLMLDRQLHRCVYERKYSKLKELSCVQVPSVNHEDGEEQGGDAALRAMLAEYLTRFSQLAGSLINCGPVLNWLELDNRGHRLIVTDEAAINTPAVAAAYVVRRYPVQAPDEIHLEVGDIISVIDMPPADESTWWRGKKGFQVGFFPCECVEIIGDKVPQTIKIPKSAAKPVLRKHGKLIAFFRQFLLSRPSRRKLKQSGILRERVFGCDLGEHLMNSGRDIPLVLKCCAEFIEEHGIVDGIYRLSGVTSNIQKLRLAFDEDRVPNLTDEAILQDIHCVASLLKMYFRELPNPLLTFHLYDKFVNAVQAEESTRLLKLRDVVQQLPPPHYRSLEYLMRHLSKVAAYGSQTGMTPKNVAIVWAPNLLRSREIENGGVGALHVVGVQAVLTEYLIRYTDIIFSDKMPTFPTMSPLLPGEETPKKTRPKSLAISTPTKLLSLEEARTRALASNLLAAQPKFIDVGGGAENLPPKYHTIIDLPGRRSGGKGKKSPSGWKSFFARGWHTASGRSKSRRNPRHFSGNPPKISGPIFTSHVNPLSSQSKAVTESDVSHTNHKKLRTVKSVESLLLLGSGPELASQNIDICDTYSPMDENTVSSQPPSIEYTSLPEASALTPTKSSSSYQKHARSVSHDSYFEHGLEINSEHREEAVNAKDSNLNANNVQLISSPQKVAQKQKLLCLETEASSPKLQKLCLKRLSQDLSSPSAIRRKTEAESSKQRDDTLKLEAKAKTTHFTEDNVASEHESLNEPKNVEFNGVAPKVTFQVGDVLTPNGENKSPVPSKSIDYDTSETENDLDDNSLVQKTSDLRDTLMSVSMEATLSNTISLSQLMSFESRNDNEPFSPGEGNSCDLFRTSHLDNSITSPESPTMDNVSDMPSSGGSEGSPPAPTEDEKIAMQRMSASWPPDEFNFKETVKESVKTKKLDNENINQETHLPTDNEIEKRKEKFSISQTDSILSPNGREMITESSFRNGHSFGVNENGVLSSPQNFGDVSKTPSGVRTNTRSIEVKEICPRFVSGVTVSGSFDFSLRDADSPWCCSKKNRSGIVSDKLSPISPVEESRRRFESEIGRLIVRDRQVRSEMERMKAERQKFSEPKVEKVSKESTIPKYNCKMNIPEFSGSVRKSPVKKTVQEEIDKTFKTSPKEDREKKKLSDWVLTSSYPQYLRIEKKPSVKELLSKFESPQKVEEKVFNKENSESPKNKLSSICNVQVGHHSTSKEFPDPQLQTNYNHIFQTECVVRFPHPKSSISSPIANAVEEPKKVILHSPGSFLNSYLRSRTESCNPQTSASSAASTSLVSLLGTSFDSILNNSPGQNLTDKFCDVLNLKRPSDLKEDERTKPCSETFQAPRLDECRPSVKLKSQFFESDLMLQKGSDISSCSHNDANGLASRRQRQSSASANRQQRPRSVPPPLLRLSVAPSRTNSDNSDKVPKSKAAVQEFVNHSTTDQPKRIRERAAVFERSLSFSGYVDRKPTVIKKCEERSFENTNNANS